MRTWLKRAAAKFHAWKKRPEKSLRSATVKINGSGEIHIPLMLHPKLIQAARKHKVLIKRTGSTRRETRIYSRSNGTELEIRFFEGESPREHRTFEYDNSGRLTRAMVTIIDRTLTTYIFFRKGNTIVLDHVEKL